MARCRGPASTADADGAFEGPGERNALEDRDGGVLAASDVRTPGGGGPRVADKATRLGAVAALLGIAARTADERSADVDVRCTTATFIAAREVAADRWNAMGSHGGYGAVLDVGVETRMRRAE